MTTKYDQVKAWLPEAIDRHAGVREEVMKEADRLGFGEQTVSRAKAELGIEHTSGRDRKWIKP